MNDTTKSLVINLLKDRIFSDQCEIGYLERSIQHYEELLLENDTEIDDGDNYSEEDVDNIIKAIESHKIDLKFYRDNIVEYNKALSEIN